jgi:hypothetical protein
MTEKTTSLLNHNRYEDRLNSTKALPDYDSLDDEQKTLLGYLAFDQDLDGLDFNEAVNGEVTKALARRVSGPALAQTVEYPVATIEQDTQTQLPKTFEEARQQGGHFVEDVVRGMQDVDAKSVEAAFGSIGELTDSDKAFYENDFLGKHLKSVAKITDRFLQFFPEKYRREAGDAGEYGAYHLQPLFLQHDSPAYLKAKLAEGKEDKPLVRLYLNPELADATSVYADFLNKALKSDLRFKSKIIRPVDMPMYKAYKSEYLDKGVGKLDPIVIYGYEESKDELLKIVEEIHQSRPESFRDRKIGGSPLEIAEGVGVGEEVSDSGESSLTSSRESAATAVLKELKDKNSNWDTVSPEARKRAFASSLRKRYGSLGYNPNNIAFNAPG